MHAPLLLRSALVLVLVATNALANEREPPAVRPILLLEHPDEYTHRIYVKGAIITTLRFEKPVDPGQTKMLGWEGRLDPLAVIRNKVILEPIHDLDADEAIPLLVTLVDGTEVSFLLRPPRTQEMVDTERPIDQQVDVFRNRDTYSSMRSALQSALQRNDALTEENERYHKEENSADHGLATLLASGAITQTPFKVVDRFSGKDATADVEAKLLRGKGKAAVLFHIKNLDSTQPWSMKSARLVTKASGQEREFALRATFRQITPGTSGVIAMVIDGAAFWDEGEWTNLFLEIHRQDGMRQILVELEPGLAAQQ